MLTWKDWVFNPGSIIIIFSLICIMIVIFTDNRRFVIYLSKENVEKLDIIKKESYIEPEAYCRKIIEEHLRSK
jgi:hypothetical protein